MAAGTRRYAEMKLRPLLIDPRMYKNSCRRE